MPNNSSDIPGIRRESLRGVLPLKAAEIIENIYDNLSYLRSKILSNTQPVIQTTAPVQSQPQYIPVGSIIVDEHLQRISTYTASMPAIGTTFYEYDRSAFYIVSKDLSGVVGWRLIVAVMIDALASRPADLGVRDAGFIFLESGSDLPSIWDGTAWVDLRSQAVIQQGTYAARPAVTASDNGLAYYATDQNVTYIVESGVWVYLCGIMIGTTTPDTRPVLTANESGFTFYSTTNGHIYIWNGAAWVTPHVTESEIDLTDLTTNNVTSTKHGLAPKSPADTYKFLNGAATPDYTYPLIHYGSMYGNEISESVTVSATDTYYDVDGSLSDGGSTAAFTFQSSMQLRCDIPGTYLVNWSMGIQAAAAAQDLSGGVGVDGAVKVNTIQHAYKATAAADCALSGTGIITLAANEVVTLMVANHTAVNNITVEHATLTLIKVA